MKLIFISLFLLFLFNNADASFIKKEGLTEDSNGWYIWKEFRLASGIPYWAIELIQPKIAEAKELTLKQKIKLWFPKLLGEKLEMARYAHGQAIENGIDPYKFLKLINCESQFEYALGDYRSETKEFMAAGPAQWWFSSWEKYTKQFGLEHLNYKNSEDQILLAAKVISEDKKGWKNWWNCGLFVGFQ